METNTRDMKTDTTIGLILITANSPQLKTL